MNKLRFLIFVCMPFMAAAQDNYKLTFDYNADTYELTKETRIKNKLDQNNNDKFKFQYEKIKHAKFREGDIIKVEVKNYNPLKYKVTIEQKQIRYKPLMEPQVMGKVMNIFNQKNAVMNFLGSEGLDLGNIARDEEEVEVHFAEKTTLEKDFHTSLNSFNDDYIKIKEQLNTYSSVLKEDLTNETLKKDDIISTIQFIRKQFKEYSVSDVINEGKRTLMLYDSAHFYSSKDEFLLKNSLTEEFENINLVINKLSEYNSSYQKIGKMINELEELQSNPNTKVDDQKFVNLIQTLENLDYVTEKTFVVHTENVGLKNTNPEGVLTDLNFEIVVYDLEKVKGLLPDEEEFTQYVKFPNDTLYYGLDGKITNVPCLTCKSLILAEGIVKGREVPTVKDVLNGNCSSCIGKWIFYNEKGEVSKIKSEPQTTILTGRDENLRKTYKIDNPEEFETAVKIKKSMKMPVAGAVAMNWTTGLFAVSPLGGRKSYETMTSNDTIEVVETDLMPFTMGLGTLMSIDFLSNKGFVPSLNIGIAVDLLNTSNLNYLAGISFRPKNLPILSVSTGLAYTLTNVLNENLEIGQYSTSEYNQLIDDASLQRNAYRLGYYAGVCIHF